MDTFSYRVFLTIAEYKSFQKAAELHHVTPPAISHLVKQLEKEFGFSLFVRNRRSVSLTTAGETLLSPIADIVKREDTLRQLVAEVNGLDQGHVCLGIFNSMCKYLPDVIRSFNDKYPHITFEIYQGSYEDIIYWLKTGIVDIGFLSQTKMLKILPEWNRLIGVSVRDEQELAPAVKKAFEYIRDYRYE